MNDWHQDCVLQCFGSCRSKSLVIEGGYQRCNIIAKLSVSTCEYIWPCLICIGTTRKIWKKIRSKSSFLAILTDKCIFLSSESNPAHVFWYPHKFSAHLLCGTSHLWKIKLFCIFRPSKSSIFLVYSHFRSVWHHFQPSLSSLPIGKSQISISAT